MRAVVQRAARARVTVDERLVGEIGAGVVVLVGIAPTDGPAEAAWLAQKIAHLRIFTDAGGKMDLSLVDVEGAALVVSQFTLYGDARKGRRPSFVHAAEGPQAQAVYERVVSDLAALGVPCATGEFGAMMAVELVNDGPVTILLDSAKTF